MTNKVRVLLMAGNAVGLGWMIADFKREKPKAFL